MTQHEPAHKEFASSAQRTMQTAIRTGRLVRGPCENCGRLDRSDGHHDDYSKPLDVRWLCPSCHGAWHAGGDMANAGLLRVRNRKTKLASGRSKRGFASMSTKAVHDIAVQGGIARSINSAVMSKIGKKGLKSRWAKWRAAKEVA